MKNQALHKLKDTFKNTDVRYFHFKDFILDTLSQELKTIDEKKIQLTDTEFKILFLFVSNPNKLFTRDDICREVLGIEFDNLDRKIDGHICRIRKKLETASGFIKYDSILKTIRFIGYQFVEEVFEVKKSAIIEMGVKSSDAFANFSISQLEQLLKKLNTILDALGTTNGQAS